MKYELWVSLRYLFGRRRERFVGIISWISILGITVGVLALIVVISVMNGFDRELRDRMVGFYAHLTITQLEGLVPSQELLGKVQSNPDVVAEAPFIQGQALVATDRQVMGVLLRGIDSKKTRNVTRIGEFIRIGGELPKEGVWLGSELAARLGVWMGDSVRLISSLDRQQHEFTVTGIFTSGMYEYDANIVILSLESAGAFLGMKDKVSGLEIRTRALELAPSVSHQLQRQLGPGFWVRSWMDLNRNLFKALQLEKTVMFVILALIVLVACFNITSTLIMMVMEKTKDVGILKAIGASPSGIRWIFTCVGLWISFFGVLIGTLGGLGVCFLLERYPIIQLPSDIYYIDRLPVEVSWNDVSWVVASAAILALLSTLYPATQAGRLDPVAALRYE